LLEDGSMPRITQLVVTLASEPGVLARVTSALREAGITIEGVCAAETIGGGKIRLLVSDLADAETVLQAGGIPCAREHAIALPLEDWPGTLATAAQQLAAVEVNITCVYATTGGNRPPEVILVVSNLSKGLAALEG
jgi:hypothetical protein